MSNKGGVRGDRIEVSVKGISEFTPIQMCFLLQKNASLPSLFTPLSVSMFQITN